MKTSLIIPVYNEEKVILKTLNKLILFLNNEKENWEIIIVNDGSTDKTLEIINNFKPNPFKIVSHTPNKGKGFAIKKGVEMATGDYIAFIDSDLAYSFENLKEALFYLKNFDIVRGSRDTLKTRKNTPILRKILGRGFNLISRILLDPHLNDTQCGLKAFRKDVAKDLFSKQTIGGFSFDTEILYLAKKKNYLIKEIRVAISEDHLDKESKVNLILDPPKMFLDLIKIRINDLLGKYE